MLLRVQAGGPESGPGLLGLTAGPGMSVRCGQLGGMWGPGRIGCQLHESIRSSGVGPAGGLAEGANREPCDPATLAAPGKPGSSWQGGGETA